MVRVSGDQTLYLQLLDKFICRFSTFEPDLMALVDRGEEAEAIRYIHTFKGVAAGLGAKTLQQLAGQLEPQLFQPTLPDILNSLVQELDLVLTQMKTALQLKGRQKDKSLGQEPELKSLLEQLPEPLFNLKVQQVQQIFDQVKAKEWGSAHQELLIELESLIAQYQFVSAAEKIQKYINQEL
jgi:HPt (histidine-containing phosphotransfer) domain-containing protein